MDECIAWESKGSEEGGFFVKEISEGFELWEIPQYGGEPLYVKGFDELADAIDFADAYCC